MTLTKDGAMEAQKNDLDLGDEDKNMDLIICINMIHVSPWDATIGLFQLASQKLRPGGILYFYGPYKVNGKTAPTNL